MNSSTRSPPACASCGALLAPGALDGLCPRCLMALNFRAPTEVPEEDDTQEDRERRSPSLPTVAEIAPHFPQLEIHECLGRGGMGVVFKARQLSLNRFVALKILAPEKSREPHFAQRFGREAMALAQLNHPSIVAVHDFGEAGGLFYLLMEFVDGVTLRQSLRNRRITPEEALAVVPKICEALQYAHERGVVHRDIKPENILLTREGLVKIADFGIAKIVSGESSPNRSSGSLPVGGESAGEATPPNLTGEGVLGTPHYMAPEQVERPHLVDHRADIYSLGVVFYEMLTGELPLGKFPPPSQKAAIDARLDLVVLGALEKEPDQRYQHASEVKSAVETIATTPAASAADAKSVTPPERAVGNSPAASCTPAWVRAVRWAARGLGTVTLVLTVGGFVAEGLPRWAWLPASHRFALVALGLVSAGCLAGWRREGTAALLIGAGWALFPIIGGLSQPGRSLFPFSVVIAVLYALCRAGVRPRKPWRLAMGGTVVAGLLVASVWFKPMVRESRPTIPTRAAQTGRNLIDLTAHYNAALGDNWHDPLDRGNHLGELPTGVQTLAGTRFDLRGLVQVEHNCRTHPPRVDGIAVGQTCQRLHFLHAAINAAWFENDTVIGQYVVHFADGQRQAVPIVLGRNLADWYSKDTYAPLTVAWIGQSPKSRREGKRIVLFKFTWDNPRPQSPVASVDFVAARRGPSPFLIALTAE